MYYTIFKLKAKFIELILKVNKYIHTYIHTYNLLTYQPLRVLEEPSLCIAKKERSKSPRLERQLDSQYGREC